MEAVHLTPNGVQAVTEGAVPSAIRPVLQILELRPVTTAKTAANPSAERYRVILSDGVHKQQAMLGTAYSQCVKDGAIRVGTVVRLVDFICNSIHNKKIIIVVGLEVLQSECAIIGSPRPYEAQNGTVVKDPNLAPTASRRNSGIYSGGPGMLGSSFAPMAEQASNNLSFGNGAQGMLGSSFAPMAEQASNNLSFGNGAQGMLGSSIGRTVDPGRNNGASYGTMLPQKTVTENFVPPVSQHPSLNPCQSQRFAASATGGSLVPPGNSYRCPEQPSYQQAPPVINRGPVGRNESIPHTVPITALNQFQKQTIKARVTAKTGVRHWNKKTVGKSFSFDLLDAEGGEIRATCFNESVDQFYDLIQVDKVYLISGGKLKPANKEFNHLNNDWEITLNIFGSSIQICSGDDSDIPEQKYSFRQISEIENMANKSMVDLLGVVTSVRPSVTIKKRNGTETRKRTLQLLDTSGRSVEVNFWENFCDVEGQQLQLKCDSGLNPILALKGARVNDFGGRSVGTINSTQLKVDPDLPDAERLKQWYITEGKAIACISLSQGTPNIGQIVVRKTIAQIKDENLGQSDMPDWITIKAEISDVRSDNFCYPACPLMFQDKLCNRKAIQNGDKMWHCERCDKIFENCEYKYVVSFQIQDHTGSTYVTAFQEAGVQIFGCSAQELLSIRDVNQDDVRFTEIIEGARWKVHLFKLKVKEETYNDERRVKCSIVKAEKLDPSKESHTLLGLIDNLLQDGLGSSPSVQSAVAPNAGFTNSPCSPSVLTPNNAYDMNTGGANLFWHQGAIGIGMSTPPSGIQNVQTSRTCESTGHNAQNCPEGAAGQQPSAGGGFTGINYGSTIVDARSDMSSKGNQPGHWSTDSPQPATGPRHQDYGNTAAPESFAGGNYGSAARNARSDTCFRCDQPGHWARDCPGKSFGGRK